MNGAVSVRPELLSTTRKGTYAALDITHSYGPVIALRNVSFVVAAGQVHALLGENGCGKSTLIKIMTGAQRPTSGRLEVDGSPMRLANPTRASARGISVVHQNYHVFPDLSVSDNILVGGRKTPKSRFFPMSVDHRAQKFEVEELLSSLGIDLDPRRLASTLDPAERKFVEIARAMTFSPRFMFLDEPTAALEPTSARRVLDLVDTLRSQGVGIVYVSHRLDEVMAIGDRFTVLRDAVLIHSGAIADVSEADIVHMMVGELHSPHQVAVGAIPTRVRFRMSAVQCEPGLPAFDLQVNTGEILGLTGLVGSGASRVVQMLGGAVPMQGRMHFGSTELSIKTPRDALRLGVGYIPEDRKGAGLVLEHSVALNVAYGSLPQFAKAGVMDFRRVEATARAYKDKLSIRLSSVLAPVASLSGGNQQKVLMSKWLVSGAQILAIEEPTQGVDISGRDHIHRLLREFVAGGGTVVLASTDVREVAALCDRIAIFRHGVLTEILDAVAIRIALEEGSDTEGLQHYLLGVMESGVGAYLPSAHPHERQDPQAGHGQEDPT